MPTLPRPSRTCLDIDEAVLVGLNEARDRLVVELLRPGHEIKRIERE